MIIADIIFVKLFFHAFRAGGLWVIVRRAKQVRLIIFNRCCLRCLLKLIPSNMYFVLLLPPNALMFHTVYKTFSREAKKDKIMTTSTLVEVN